jgi:hypothetical protein
MTKKQTQTLDILYRRALAKELFAMMREVPELADLKLQLALLTALQRARRAAMDANYRGVDILPPAEDLPLALEILAEWQREPVKEAA